MSSTNKTANYNLSQFIGSDKPAWLVDYNGDMAAIDTQMKANADAAAAAQSTANGADGKADANATAISSLNTQINGASGIADDLSSVQGAVNTINSLIGNGEPTTTDKTIIGAINELDAGTVKEADLENLYALKNVDTYVRVTADGVKTYAELLKDVADAFLAALQTLANDEIAVPRRLAGQVVGKSQQTISPIPKTNSATDVDRIEFNIVFYDEATHKIYNRTTQVSTTAANCYAVNFTVDTTDNSVGNKNYATDVPTSGWVLDIHYAVYKKLA